MNFLQEAYSQFLAQSVPEAIAVACAIAYLVFAIRQQQVCWLFAAISSAIYIWLLISAALYMESVLHAFYFGMAVYGFAIWHSKSPDGTAMQVVSWPVARHATAIAAIGVLGLANGYLLASFTDAAYPYIDSLTTWFAIFATYLVAQKVLENWWYWLVIDLVSIFIYFSRDLKLSAALFAIYVLMIPFGLLAWRRSMRREAMA